MASNVDNASRLFDMIKTKIFWHCDSYLLISPHCSILKFRLTEFLTYAKSFAVNSLQPNSNSGGNTDVFYLISAIKTTDLENI